MRAREFIDEERYRRRRILVPKDPRTIELHKQQYELGKKWAEYQGKLADLKTKLKDDRSVIKNRTQHGTQGFNEAFGRHS